MTPRYEHVAEAAAEGWCLSYFGSKLSGDWQVQKFDDSTDHTLPDGTHPPQLYDDDAAFAIVANGQQPHHSATREFLRLNNPREFVLVMKFKGRPNN